MTWEESLRARRWPAPCSKHYSQGYADGYSLITPQPPRHSTAANRPAWLLDNADWYTKGYNHGYVDRAEVDAIATVEAGAIEVERALADGTISGLFCDAVKVAQGASNG